jgi:hypothetical protein
MGQIFARRLVSVSRPILGMRSGTSVSDAFAMSPRLGATSNQQRPVESAWTDQGQGSPSHRRSPPAGVGPSTLDPRLVAVVEKVVHLVLDESGRLDGTPRAKRERPDERRLYDVPSAAGQLSVSPAKAWELIKDGRLRAVKVDGRTLVQATELDRFAVEEVRVA